MHLGPFPLSPVRAVRAACAALALVALAGCDGGGGGGPDSPDLGAAGAPDRPADDGAGPDTGAIAGLYDASYPEFGALDVAYVDIGSDGAWTEYDYEGDDFDAGGECYSVIEYRVTPLEGDRYRIEGPGQFEGGREAVLRRVGDTLRVAFANDDGDVGGSVTEIWPVLAGLSPVNFEPC